MHKTQFVVCWCRRVKVHNYYLKMNFSENELVHALHGHIKLGVLGSLLHHNYVNSSVGAINAHISKQFLATTAYTVTENNY